MIKKVLAWVWTLSILTSWLNLPLYATNITYNVGDTAVNTGYDQKFIPYGFSPYVPMDDGRVVLQQQQSKGAIPATSYKSWDTYMYNVLTLNTDGLSTWYKAWPQLHPKAWTIGTYTAWYATQSYLIFPKTVEGKFQDVQLKLKDLIYSDRLWEGLRPVVNVTYYDENNSPILNSFYLDEGKSQLFSPLDSMLYGYQQLSTTNSAWQKAVISNLGVSESVSVPADDNTQLNGQTTLNYVRPKDCTSWTQAGVWCRSGDAKLDPQSAAESPTYVYPTTNEEIVLWPLWTPEKDDNGQTLTTTKSWNDSRSNPTYPHKVGKYQMTIPLSFKTFEKRSMPYNVDADGEKVGEKINLSPVKYAKVSVSLASLKDPVTQESYLMCWGFKEDTLGGYTEMNKTAKGIMVPVEELYKNSPFSYGFTLDSTPNTVNNKTYSYGDTKIKKKPNGTTDWKLSEMVNDGILKTSDGLVFKNGSRYSINSILSYIGNKDTVASNGGSVTNLSVTDILTSWSKKVAPGDLLQNGTVNNQEWNRASLQKTDLVSRRVIQDQLSSSVKAQNAEINSITQYPGLYLFSNGAYSKLRAPFWAPLDNSQKGKSLSNFKIGLNISLVKTQNGEYLVKQTPDVNITLWQVISNVLSQFNSEGFNTSKPTMMDIKKQYQYSALVDEVVKYLNEGIKRNNTTVVDLFDELNWVQTDVGSIRDEVLHLTQNQLDTFVLFYNPLKYRDISYANDTSDFTKINIGLELSGVRWVNLDTKYFDQLGTAILMSDKKITNAWGTSGTVTKPYVVPNSVPNMPISSQEFQTSIRTRLSKAWDKVNGITENGGSTDGVGLYYTPFVTTSSYTLEDCAKLYIYPQQQSSVTPLNLPDSAYREITNNVQKEEQRLADLRVARIPYGQQRYYRQEIANKASPWDYYHLNEAGVDKDLYLYPYAPWQGFGYTPFGWNVSRDFRILGGDKKTPATIGTFPFNIGLASVTSPDYTSEEDKKSILSEWLPQLVGGSPGYNWSTLAPIINNYAIETSTQGKADTSDFLKLQEDTQKYCQAIAKYGVDQWTCLAVHDPSNSSTYASNPWIYFSLYDLGYRKDTYYNEDDSRFTTVEAAGTPDLKNKPAVGVNNMRDIEKIFGSLKTTGVEWKTVITPWTREGKASQYNLSSIGQIINQSWFFSSMPYSVKKQYQGLVGSSQDFTNGDTGIDSSFTWQTFYPSTHMTVSGGGGSTGPSGVFQSDWSWGGKYQDSVGGISRYAFNLSLPAGERYLKLATYDWDSKLYGWEPGLEIKLNIQPVTEDSKLPKNDPKRNQYGPQIITTGVKDNTVNFDLQSSYNDQNIDRSGREVTRGQDSVYDLATNKFYDNTNAQQYVGKVWHLTNVTSIDNTWKSLFKSTSAPSYALDGVEGSNQTMFYKVDLYALHQKLLEQWKNNPEYLAYLKDWKFDPNTKRLLNNVKLRFNIDNPDRFSYNWANQRNASGNVLYFYSNGLSGDIPEMKKPDIINTTVELIKTTKKVTTYSVGRDYFLQPQDPTNTKQNVLTFGWTDAQKTDILTFRVYNNTYDVNRPFNNPYLASPRIDNLTFEALTPQEIQDIKSKALAVSTEKQLDFWQGETKLEKASDLEANTSPTYTAPNGKTYTKVCLGGTKDANDPYYKDKASTNALKLKATNSSTKKVVEVATDVPPQLVCYYRADGVDEQKMLTDVETRTLPTSEDTKNPGWDKDILPFVDITVKVKAKDNRDAIKSFYPASNVIKEAFNSSCWVDLEQQIPYKTKDNIISNRMTINAKIKQCLDGKEILDKFVPQQYKEGYPVPEKDRTNILFVLMWNKVGDTPFLDLTESKKINNTAFSINYDDREPSDLCVDGDKKAMTAANGSGTFEWWSSTCSSGSNTNGNGNGTPGNPNGNETPPNGNGTPGNPNGNETPPNGNGTPGNPNGNETPPNGNNGNGTPNDNEVPPVNPIPLGTPVSVFPKITAGKKDICIANILPKDTNGILNAGDSTYLSINQATKLIDASLDPTSKLLAGQVMSADPGSALQKTVQGKKLEFKYTVTSGSNLFTYTLQYKFCGEEDKPFKEFEGPPIHFYTEDNEAVCAPTGLCNIVPTTPDGHAQPVKEVHRGDIINYNISCNNTTGKDVYDVQVQLPTPENTNYISGPKETWVSLGALPNGWKIDYTTNPTDLVKKVSVKDSTYSNERVKADFKSRYKVQESDDNYVEWQDCSKHKVVNNVQDQTQVSILRGSCTPDFKDYEYVTKEGETQNYPYKVNPGMCVSRLAVDDANRTEDSKACLVVKYYRLNEDTTINRSPFPTSVSNPSIFGSLNGDTLPNSPGVTNNLSRIVRYGGCGGWTQFTNDVACLQTNSTNGSSESGHEGWVRAKFTNVNITGNIVLPSTFDIDGQGYSRTNFQWATPSSPILTKTTGNTYSIKVNFQDTIDDTLTSVKDSSFQRVMENGKLYNGWSLSAPLVEVRIPLKSISKWSDSTTNNTNVNYGDKIGDSNEIKFTWAKINFDKKKWLGKDTTSWCETIERWVSCGRYSAPVYEFRLHNDGSTTSFPLTTATNKNYTVEDQNLPVCVSSPGQWIQALNWAMQVRDLRGLKNIEHKTLAANPGSYNTNWFLSQDEDDQVPDAFKQFTPTGKLKGSQNLGFSDQKYDFTTCYKYDELKNEYDFTQAESVNPETHKCWNGKRPWFYAIVDGDYGRTYKVGKSEIQNLASVGMNLQQVSPTQPEVPDTLWIYEKNSQTDANGNTLDFVLGKAWVTNITMKWMWSIFVTRNIKNLDDRDDPYDPEAPEKFRALLNINSNVSYSSDEIKTGDKSSDISWDALAIVVNGNARIASNVEKVEGILFVRGDLVIEESRQPIVLDRVYVTGNIYVKRKPTTNSAVDKITGNQDRPVMRITGGKNRYMYLQPRILQEGQKYFSQQQVEANDLNFDCKFLGNCKQ